MKLLLDICIFYYDVDNSSKIHEYADGNTYSWKTTEDRSIIYFNGKREFTGKKAEKVMRAAALLIAGLLASGLVFARGATEESGESAQPEGASPIEGVSIPEDAAREQVQEQVQEKEEDSFEQAKSQIKQQLIREKQNEILMNHIEELRGEAEVETYLDRAGGDDESAVVAAVNGEEILNGDLMIREQQQMQQYAAMGLDPESENAKALLQRIRPQILESLISLELVGQKAETEGFSADESQVDEQYQRFVDQFGGEQALEEQLAAENLTKEELRSDIANQLNINEYLQQYIEDNVKPEDFAFSEQELRERYEQQMQQQKQMEQMQKQMEQMQQQQQQ